jgi:hypothetical protein
MLTVERLKEILHYDPLTGLFTWLVTVNYNAKAGSIAGTLNKSGYILIMIDRKSYRAHRLAFLYMTGEWPKNLVDHKPPGVKSDNRWENLREATYSQNACSRKTQEGTKSGLKGVTITPTGKHHVSIRVEGDVLYLGTYEKAVDAATAYNDAAKILHGEFAWLI